MARGCRVRRKLAVPRAAWVVANVPTVERVLMADEATIQRAAATLLEAAHAPARVILFGSHAQGRAGPDSDLDFLVIEEVVESRVEEAGRLRSALGNLGAPVDILVYSEAQVREWGEVENTALFEALREGRVLEGA